MTEGLPAASHSPRGASGPGALALAALFAWGACAGGAPKSDSPRKSAAPDSASAYETATTALESGVEASPPPDAVAPEPGWPRWLETPAGVSTRETSGLTFVGRNAQGGRVFLVADDVGSLWRLIVSGADDALALVPIPIEGAARDTLAPYPKKDLEEIGYCPMTGRVLLSVEGNVPKDQTQPQDFRRWLALYDVTLEPNPLEAVRATRFARVDVPEWDEASRLAAPNIGFEGLVLCGDTLVLGLEGVSEGQNIFADSTLIEVFDLAHRTRREVSTKSYGVVTITGLTADRTGRFFGIDRNSARVFTFRLEHGVPADVRTKPLSMPGVRGVPYAIPSAEAIAVDDEGFLWIAVDPWMYTPLSREGLSAHDLDNYKKQVPLLYKYRDPFAAPDEGARRGAG